MSKDPEPKDPRLSTEHKEMLARRYERLNSLLKEKKEVDDMIAELSAQINSLQKRSQTLDEAFHKHVIEVEPTQVIDLRKPRSPSPAATSKSQQAKLIEVLTKNPKLAELVAAELGLE